MSILNKTDRRAYIDACTFNRVVNCELQERFVWFRQAKKRSIFQGRKELIRWMYSCRLEYLNN